jgi:glycosyltransferase involved in cell wall biosynthesis
MENTVQRVDRRIRVKPRVLPEPPATVTVVIPCYNYANFLPQSVHSCLAQKDVEVDVIIVDDASTDASLSVAKDLAATNLNVSVLAHERNSGMVETFNDGAKIASGEFLVRLDADDLLTPGSLARATQLARAYPSVGLVYGHPIHFSTESLPEPRGQASAWTIWPGRDWLGGRCRSGQNVITSPEVLMRRSVVEQIGYQAPLRHTPDMEFWLRISAFADIAYIHGADQAWHRDHPNSMSAKEVDGRGDLAERFEVFETLFGGLAGEIPGADELFRDARGALVSEALYTAGLELDRGLPDPGLFAAYLAFAKDVDPGIDGSALWETLSRRATSPAPAVSANLLPFLRRVKGRIRSNVNWRKWHRNGVF